MITVRVMQVAVDQITNVVAMWDGFMSAAWAMNMSGLVAVTMMVGRAGVWIAVAHFDDVLVHMVAVGMVQVTVMEIIDVITVLYGGVPAAGSMLVRMIFVFWICAIAHLDPHSMA